MDLSTEYLGLKLPHPLMPGASPMVDDLDTVRRLEDAGAAAIVMHSLFEEQLNAQQAGTLLHMEHYAESFSEATSYFPSPQGFRLGPEQYLEQIGRIKEVVDVPVIASLNGISDRGWLEYASSLEKAGADAIELNVYALSTDPEETAEMVEMRSAEMLRRVKSTVRIPVAVKLSPFHTSLAHFARRLQDAGADGLVLFNRFYQPNIDIEELEVLRTLEFSTPAELNLRLTWLAVLSGQIRSSFAASGGIHTAAEAIKALMAGAHTVQMVSVLLERGPERLALIRREMTQWLEDHEYESLDQLRGSMSLTRCPDPKMYERANYVQVLQSWRG